MTLFERRVPDGDGELIITVRTDSRLKKSVRWTVQDQTVLVRAPQRIPRRDLERMVDSIVAQLRKKRQRARSQGDAELQNRAEAINRTCFGGELAWNSIRWVNNMEKRLGSCTSGGPTDGDIRISSRIRDWPEYVVDYVIAHELAHRRYPDHSRAFWDYLTRYPQTERARGFVEGVAYASQTAADDLL